MSWGWRAWSTRPRAGWPGTITWRPAGPWPRPGSCRCFSRQAGADGPVEVSPELPCLIAQDTLEPVLRRAAEQAGAIVRFGTELLGFGQDETGVTAALTGGESLRARYLVAADGAHSPVRAALGITRSGPGFTGGPMVSVYFRADLGAVVRGREFNLCQIEHPDAPGGLASVDGRLRWVFMSPGAAQGRDWPRDWPSVLRTALGVTAPDLEVLSVLPWRSEMRVADRYRDGRVFLAGDAAHVMPPFAASGANTGLADGHNLAWKLAAVLRGQAGDALLDSYHAERRPAGWFAAGQSARRTGDLRRPGVGGDGLAHPYVLGAGGFQYPAGALAGDPLSDPEPVTEFRPAGRVGTRVPHRWLDVERRRSTIDVAGPGLGRAPGAGRPGLPAGRAVPAAAPRPHRGLARPLPRGHRGRPGRAAPGAAGIGVTSEAPCPCPVGRRLRG